MRQRAGIASGSALRGGTVGTRCKIGWIADNQRIALFTTRRPFKNIGLMNPNSIRPRRGGHVFLRLLCRRRIKFDGINLYRFRRTLCQHQRNQTAARSYIQHAGYVGNRCPGTEQHTVRAHLHGATIVSDKKLFKGKPVGTENGFLLRHLTDLKEKRR